MSKDMMRYDLMAQEALRGVVRSALEIVAKEGLPGEHHFFIAFDTNFPGVEISDELHERYPEDMTIVIQHQFWDLKVHDDYFEISLTFSKVLEKLVIPYAAIKGFFDPSVQFGLQFQGDAGQGEGGALPAPEAMKQLPPTGTEDETAGDSEAGEEHGQVVSLDAFRKK
jgi:hypothetical protein